MIHEEADANVRHRGKFYELRPSFWGDGRFSGIKVVNEDRLLEGSMNTMDPPTGDPDQYPGKPHLVHLPEEGGLPCDFEKLAGIWIVSDALKRVLEAVDPQGFAFVACDFTLADGSAGPQYHLADVIRQIDALDEGASRVKIEYEKDYVTGGEDVKLYSVSGGASLVFREDIIGDAHAFRQPQLGMDAICDRVMADALRAASLDGVMLRDVADY